MNLDALLWLIPAAPFVGFLLNGWIVGPSLQRVSMGLPARKPAVAAHGHDGHGHGHDDHGHDHGAPAGDHDDHGHGHHGPVNAGPLGIIAAIAVVGPLISFVLSVLALMRVGADGQGAHGTYFSWFSTGGLEVGFGLQVDALTAVMLMFVTGIGTLIHLYSYGYMNHDAGFYRFMAYLNLFLFSMLCLVLGDNLLVMFLGWEGVGLASYLLIGFWFEDLANVDAGRKAFVFNRVGDFAFLIGMFTLFGLAGTLDFAGLRESIQLANVDAIVPAGAFAGWKLGSVLTLAAGALFVGATGKSAQIPLFVWLPDAMAGPTPVSALIHAATMVTAGVYMIARLNFLFALTPGIMAIVGLVAAFTALISALIAFSQNDIKKVLAYSTVSQLGFMFAGMATTFWVTGLFHVITHAFFKALLFLGAGAIIHALDNEQDIRKMGGLWKDMRLEAVLFITGAIALAGVPPFAGFWSKDEILGNLLILARVGGGIWWLVFVIMLVTAMLTAFYTTRLVVMTFFGPPADPHRHPHKTHWTMLLPLVILAILSVGGGLALGSPLSHALEHFTAPIFVAPDWHAGISHDMEHSSHQIAMVLSIVGALLGIGLGWRAYSGDRKAVHGFVRGGGAPLYELSANKFFIDELYQKYVIDPTKNLASVLFKLVDRGLIDGVLVEGSARVASGLGVGLKHAHTGTINTAAGWMAVGAFALLAYLGWMLVRF